MSWLCSKAPNNFHLHLLKAKFVSHPSLPLWLLTLTYSASGMLSSIFRERLRTLTFAGPSVMWLTLHFLEDIIQTSLGERLPLTTLFDTAGFSNVLRFSACSTLSSLLYFLSLSPSNLLCTLLIYFSVSLHETVSSGRAGFGVLSIAVSPVLSTVSDIS